jgi:subtilisin-like proprotein convertase family protein
MSSSSVPGLLPTETKPRLEKHKTSTTQDEKTVFGPFKFTASEGPVTRTFTAPASLQRATLSVVQFDGLTGSARVDLNGEHVVDSAEFQGGIHSVSKEVALSTYNSIGITVESASGQPVLVTIAGVPAAAFGIKKSPDFILVGEPTDVTVTSRVSYDVTAPAPVVTLRRVDSTGTVLGVEGPMVDDGITAGDETKGDGVFSIVRNYISSQEETRYFRIEVQTASDTRYSNVFELVAYEPLTPAQTHYAATLEATALRNFYARLDTVGWDAAAASVLADLEQDPNVVSAVLAIDKETIQVNYIFELTDYIFLTVISSAPDDPGMKSGHSTSHGAAPNKNVARQALASSTVARSSTPANTILSSPSTSTPDTIGRSNAIVLLPFEGHNIANFGGLTPVIYQLQNKDCPEIQTEYYFDTDVTVERLRTMSLYGIVVIESHAASPFPGESPGHSSVFLSGEPTEDILGNQTEGWTRYADDIASDRAHQGTYYEGLGDIGILEKHTFCVNSDFVRHWATQNGRYPNSLVYYTGCNTLKTRVMADGFLDSGANIVIGYDDFIQCHYVQQDALEYFDNFLNTPDATTVSAYEDNCHLITHKGEERLSCTTYFRPQNAPILPPAKLPARDRVRNGDFEEGLTDWGLFAFEGSIEALSEFGPFVPPSGQYMGRLHFNTATGHPSTNTAGLRQSVECPVGGVRFVEFDYNFIAPYLGQLAPTFCNWNPYPPALPLLYVTPFGDESHYSGYLLDNVGLGIECLGMTPTQIPCSLFSTDSAPCSGTVWSTGWRHHKMFLNPTALATLDQKVTFTFRLDSNETFIDPISIGGRNTTYPYGVTVLLDNVRVYGTEGSGSSKTSRGAELGPPPVSTYTRLKGVERTSYATTFSNSDSISVPDSDTATPFSSNIEVLNLQGPITNVAVSLNGLSHTFPDDLDLILVPPGDALPVMLMSDAGGGRDLEEVTLTFDAAATEQLPDDAQIVTGTYQPTNHAQLFVDDIDAPAPAGPYATTLSALDGYGANGTWRLFVKDNATGDLGEVEFGWSLSLETGPCPEITILPETLPNGTVGVPYSATLTAIGGLAPYVFGKPGGGHDKLRTVELGNGLTLNETTGVISGTPYEEGATFFTVTVTDATRCGAQKDFEITFNPSNSPPTARCKNVTVAAGAGCTANASIDDGSDDPNGDQLTLTQSPAGPYPLGTTQVTLTATDPLGAWSQCSATVTVVDQTAPSITCPGTVSATAPLGQCATTVTYSQPSVSDNCSGATVSCAPSSGSTFPVGATTVTCTATDGASNSTQCSFTVSVTASTPAPGSVSGTANPLTGDHGSGYTYTVTNPEVGVSYTWSAPTGATILSGQGTSSIQARFGLTSGNVSVIASTPCESASPVSLAVTLSGFDFEFTGSGTPTGWTSEVGTWQQNADTYENPAHALNVSGEELYESVSYGEVYGDFTYEASIVTTRSGANVGASNTLWIRATPSPFLASQQRWNRGYAFNIAMTGRFSIFSYTTSGFTALQSWKTPVGTTIHTDGVTPNVLKIVASGTTLDFYINGVLVKTLTGQTLFTTGKVGVALVRTNNQPGDMLQILYAKLAIAGTPLPKVSGTGDESDEGEEEPNEEGSGWLPGSNPLFDTWGAASGMPLPTTERGARSDRAPH